MELTGLILYGATNLLMVLVCLFGAKGRIYECPFWIGMLSLGWFYPMAVKGFFQLSEFPGNSYAHGLLFASLCSGALWFGFARGKNRVPEGESWLSQSFQIERLIPAAGMLCLTGFFFQYKLSTLPEEMLGTQWSGAAVKYLFLASVFKFGFLALWIIYLKQQKFLNLKVLLFIVPSFMLLLQTAVVAGRRAGMMDLAAYVFIILWFVRKYVPPRGIMVGGVCAGLLMVNAIGAYRAAMANEALTMPQRLQLALQTVFAGDEDGEEGENSLADFKNYIIYRQVFADEGKLNFGLSHWNGLVWNFVPGQLVGRGLKRSLMLQEYNPLQVAKERYGHIPPRGTVSTGYNDAYSSFAWMGFVKFGLIGWIMGVLYRHAMAGHFLAQLLYVYLLGTGMHAVSHGTQQILVSKWVYFFALGYPVFRWARLNPEQENVQNRLSSPEIV